MDRRYSVKRKYSTTKGPSNKLNKNSINLDGFV